MSSKRTPGMAPLGHNPSWKGSLEGPKKHHDEHGMNASVPMKGKGEAVPSGHWEKMYSLTDTSKTMKATEGADFAPKCSQDRMTTHLKVNREDH